MALTTRLLPLVLLFVSVASAQEVNALGVPLPADAAPRSAQRVRLFHFEGTYMERFKTTYKRTAGTELIAEPLLRINKDQELIPAGALSWEVSDDGYTWFFRLRPGMQWNDGDPLTAEDYVFTLRRGADPANAYDFEWFYRPIKNWTEVVAGRKPLTELGVEAVDELTLAVHTEEKIPYLPYILIGSWPSPEQAIAKYGDPWSTSPETHVSSGPYRLVEWQKNHRMVLKLNPAYRGAARPHLEEIVFYLYSQAGQPPMLAAYEAGEVDHVELTSQAALARIKSDPVLSRELHKLALFQTYYLTMDTYNSVFKDVRVRQGFAHAIDRKALVNSILRDIAKPAYSMLPSGFPGANPEGLRTYQRYDPELARRLLAEAGYPNGVGFPSVSIWVRGLEGHLPKKVAEGIQALLRQVLNIEVGVQRVETKVFMDALNSHTLTLALVPYAHDYPDPSNLLGIWLSNGRHAWHNEQFERLIGTANILIDDPSKRLDLYQEAERILVSEAGGVFVWHPIQQMLWKSYIRSPDLEPNRQGLRFWSFDALLSMYIAAEDQGAEALSWPERFWQWLRQ